jgi:hypothetical protein
VAVTVRRGGQGPKAAGVMEGRRNASSTHTSSTHTSSTHKVAQQQRRPQRNRSGGTAAPSSVAVRPSSGSSRVAKHTSTPRLTHSMTPTIACFTANHSMLHGQP